VYRELKANKGDFEEHGVPSSRQYNDKFQGMVMKKKILEYY
jgi:hypothetical protein